MEAHLPGEGASGQGLLDMWFEPPFLREDICTVRYPSYLWIASLGSLRSNQILSLSLLSFLMWISLYIICFRLAVTLAFTSFSERILYVVAASVCLWK